VFYVSYAYTICLSFTDLLYVPQSNKRDFYFVHKPVKFFLEFTFYIIKIVILEQIVPWQVHKTVLVTYNCTRFDYGACRSVSKQALASCLDGLCMSFQVQPSQA